MNRGVNFAAKFDPMRKEGQSEIVIRTEGAAVCLFVRRRRRRRSLGQRDAAPETAVVWSGDFKIEFRDATVRLSAGQCCVMPAA